jgi:hypothetical protein
MNTSKLDREMAAYRRELPQLIAEEGRYVVIFGDTVIGTFDAYPDALKAGYAKAKLAPFLVKKISGTESVAFITRDVRFACQQ